MNIMELNAQLPYGSEFSKLRQSGRIYVDKTYQICQLAIDDEPKFLSRPRRFGKSTIASTLKELFTHGVKPYVDENGVEHESCFKGLAIEKLWKDEGKYKVIHFDFSKFDFDIVSYENTLDSNVPKSKSKLYAQYFNYTFSELIFDYAEALNVTISPRKKSPSDQFEDLVKKIGQNNVVLLIDEYDCPLTHVVNALTPDEYKEYLSSVTETLRAFYATVKANCQNFRKVFITGITRYKDVSMLTLGNTIKDISKDVRYGAIVGFTREELKKYFPEHLKYSVAQIENKDITAVTENEVEALLDKMAIWYDGYSFDECVQSHVFSTISVISFFDNIMSKTRFQNYWYDLGGTPSILVNNFQKIVNGKK